jgi:hypothetical protein
VVAVDTGPYSSANRSRNCASSAGSAGEEGGGDVDEERV